MKNLLLFTFLLFFVNAQSEAQEVISSSGDYYDNGSISVSWTLGEPVTETISDGTNILTQGFQQSKLSATEIFNISSDNINITLFPNPTQDYINLKTSDFKDLTYNISDINGRLLNEGKVVSQNTEISVNKLPAAVYFFKIINNNKVIRIFKIIKQ